MKKFTVLLVVVLFILALSVIFLSIQSKGQSMEWEKRPLWESSLSSEALIVNLSGTGFWGGYVFDSDQDSEFKDFRQDIAVHKASIQYTSDDWKTRVEIYHGRGEIKSFFRSGNKEIVALNRLVSLETLVETAQFIGWNGNAWREISSLPYRVVRVWGSEGPALLAVGYPQEGFDPVYASLSQDGGHTWNPLSLSGVNVAEDSLKLNTILFPDGGVFCAMPSGLNRLDLGTARDAAGWQRVRPYPPSFKPLAMVRRDQGLFVFGSIPDKGFAIWYTRADGTGGESLTPCRGIPEGFRVLNLRDVDGQLYLVGRVRYLVQGEMRGFDHFILRSTTPAGAHWEDMRLPITGSLSAVDFGKDGRVWAIAPGNRLQIFKAGASRL